MSLNPLRLVKNLFVDFLLAVSGTWIGAPDDQPWEDGTSDEQSKPSAR
ncbi:MAG: hypothetical protein AB8B57_12660 [Congregibacter sp.]